MFFDIPQDRVASITDQPSKLACLVIVVDNKSFYPRDHPTEFTESILVLLHLVIVGRAYAIEFTSSSIDLRVGVPPNRLIASVTHASSVLHNVFVPTPTVLSKWLFITTLIAH